MERSEVSTIKEVEKSSIYTLIVKPVDLPSIIEIDNCVVQAISDTGAQRSFMSNKLVMKYFYFKNQKPEDINVLATVTKLLQS